ncbi:unnamed protein product [Paramecium sonneborni]|uniref:Uncharacterized protein n=1 Tax=Paramecium sonneborni TaxID=65129 RepID=A0A8S1QBG2_9CILI|nr:unnamed protein product [Paramecium sonneborni]
MEKNTCKYKFMLIQFRNLEENDQKKKNSWCENKQIIYNDENDGADQYQEELLEVIIFERETIKELIIGSENLEFNEMNKNKRSIQQKLIVIIKQWIGVQILVAINLSKFIKNRVGILQKKLI